MKITKFGHSCFVVEPKEGVRVMTDPGAFSPRADAILQDWVTFIFQTTENLLKQAGIKFRKLELGKEEDL